MSRFFNTRLAQLREYIPGEQPKIQDLIKLNTNESPFAPAPGVLAAVEEAAKKLQLYNDPTARNLNAAIAKVCGVKENQVITGNGSDEILAFAFQAFGECGLAFPDITYGFYPVWAALYGMDAKIIPLNDRYEIDVNDYSGNDRTVVIANPNAPTGKALPLSAIETLLRMNPDHIVIVDEAYVDFGAESAIRLLDQYENLLVVRTFSKSRQLAGARLGFAIGQPPLIDDLNRIRNSFHPYNVNTMTQAAGIAAVKDTAYFESCRKAVMENREWTTKELEKLGFSVLPSMANFVFAAAPGISGMEYQQALRKNNIIVRYFDTPRIKAFVRITIGSREQMEKLIEVTKEILK
ncbi:MAG: histidinol-phosphate transaminase [Clostridiales bacterium]|nr:histidinol-phosphate transaminase [Clostridiales bacterium]